MTYSLQSIREMTATLPEALNNLRTLLTRHIHIASSRTGPIHEHLVHGVGRRLSILRESMKNIFASFPPSRTNKLSETDLSNTQINLQAFCINTAGIFDNWAWAFVLRHDLLRDVRGKHGVDLFGERLAAFLPQPLSVQVEAMRPWREKYLKSYRDSLAHRIPLFIPPFTLSAEESEMYRLLERERQELLFTGELADYEAKCEKLEQLGSAYPVFLHSFDFDEEYKPVILHPQILSDCATVVECGNVFLQHWEQRS